MNLNISLNSGLLLAMDDEARWSIINNFIPSQKIPYFVDYLETGLLYKLDLKRVEITIPADKKQTAHEN